MRWLPAAEWERSPSLLPTPAELVRRRFDEGARCLVMQARDSGQLLYHLWLSTSGAWIGWIGARVVPPAGCALVFDTWAHHDWRRGRLHMPGACEVGRLVHEEGLTGMVAGVEADELLPSVSMYARPGLGCIAPYEIFVWHRLGPLSFHRSVRPPEQLLRKCADLHRRHAPS